jgi:1,2-diacylglycerol 3-alpha-glucosyltransferase
MSRRLVIITEIISPYRIPLFNALSERSDVDLHVIFLAETDPELRQWQIYKNEIKFSYKVLPSWRKRVGAHNVLLNFGVTRALRKARPDVILCGGYNYPASWEALFWARIRRVPFYLWSESHAQELRKRRPLVEFAKGKFLFQCSGFVVPGKVAREYLLTHKIRQDAIFTAVNAVDSEWFAAAAAIARKDAAQVRTEFELPARYFLFVGRLVPEKGVFELLSAYAKLDASLRREVGLVFVGDGVCREELEKQAALISPGAIRFPGFVQRERLPVYYGLAEMIVLPTYTDTWGLVVNEAMACGLPVILSRAAGCSSDLIVEGWNGYVIPSQDGDSLARAMQNLARHSDLCADMGANSQKRILEFSPRHWSAGIAQMLDRTEEVGE